MPQWEYRTLDVGDLFRKVDDVLNGAGAEGWELVAVTVNGIAFFKRQIENPGTKGAALLPKPFTQRRKTTARTE